VSARDQARGVVGIERPAALAVVVRGGVGDREAADEAVSAINSQVVLGAEDADQELGLDPPRRLIFRRARAAALEDPATSVSICARLAWTSRIPPTPVEEPRLTRHPHLSAAPAALCITLPARHQAAAAGIIARLIPDQLVETGGRAPRLVGRGANRIGSVAATSTGCR
jgi:hypothetical protein